MSNHPPSRPTVELPAVRPTIEESVRCPLLDQDAEAWIRCCTARFLPLARRVAGDDAVAHDALQESWIIVLQKLRQYQGGPPACSWVAAIVRHEAIHGLMAKSPQSAAGNRGKRISRALASTIAVGPDGTCACTLSTPDDQRASAAPDVRGFESVLASRLAEAGVRGRTGDDRG